jgi:hypothetical protein
MSSLPCWGVSPRTLQDWEQGRRAPTGAAKTLLRVSVDHPEVLRELHLGSQGPRTTRACSIEARIRRRVMGWPGDPMKPRETTMRRACSGSACTRSAVMPPLAAPKATAPSLCTGCARSLL